MTSSPEPFQCDVLPDGERRVVLRPVGELDIATAPEVDRELGRLRDAGFKELVLDLRAVPFMDSSGLRVVLRWNELVADNGCTFAIIRGPELVQRVFQATRVADALTFADST
jgi:anti-sigma B factor antagonist